MQRTLPSSTFASIWATTGTHTELPHRDQLKQDCSFLLPSNLHLLYLPGGACPAQHGQRNVGVEQVCHGVEDVYVLTNLPCDEQRWDCILHSWGNLKPAFTSG